MGMWDKVRDRTYGIAGHAEAPAKPVPPAARPATPARAAVRAEPAAPVDDADDDNSDTVITDNPHALHAQIAAATNAARSGAHQVAAAAAVAIFAPGEEEVPDDAVIDAGAIDDTEDLRGARQTPSRELQEVAAQVRESAARRAIPAVADADDAGEREDAEQAARRAAEADALAEEIANAALSDGEDDGEASTDDGEGSDWLRITRETDWATISKEERWEKTKEIAQGMDWHSYDYKKSPAADFKFQDFTEAEMAKKAPWLPKHYNKVSAMETCHVPDLNQMADGKERRLFALYGVPVQWPSKKDEPDELNALLDELDQAKAEGGEPWKEAMDNHGLVNDEHYQWLKYYKLGWSEELAGPGIAVRVEAEIDAAIVEGNADDLLKQYGFRDQAHFEWFKVAVKKAKGKAWAEVNVVLQETWKKLDERFEKNKEALKDELAPYKGVSMEDWAGANAKLAQAAPLEEILKVLQIERPQWDDVNAEWNARMSRDTTATIATVYGQAFTGAGQGKFGAAGANVSSSMKAGFGKDVAGGDPMPFETWIKIQCHMNAASGQGVDPNAVLKQYDMTAADWGTVGGYWAMKMNSNPQEYLEKYSVLSAKYSQQFATAGAGSEIEF